MTVIPIHPRPSRADRNAQLERFMAESIEAWSVEGQPIPVRIAIWREAVRQAARRFRMRSTTVERTLFQLHAERQASTPRRHQMRITR